MVIFLNRDVLFLLLEETQNTQQLTQRIIKYTLSDVCYNPGVCVPPVLSLLGLGLLVASRHLGFVADLSGGADLDGRVLKRGGTDGHFGTALRDRQTDRQSITDVDLHVLFQFQFI